MMEIDDFDRRILALVQRDSRKTTAEIAAQVGLSPSAVQRRLNDLRRDKIIERDASVLDPAKLGLNMAFILSLRLVSDKPWILRDVESALRHRPEIQQCYHVTGTADFFIILYARDMEHFKEISRELFYDNTLIGRFETHVVVDRLKASLELPLGG